MKPAVVGLRAYRLRKSMTVREFAAQVGWSPSAVSQVETGALEAGDGLVMRLAEAFKLPLSRARSLVERKVMVDRTGR